MFSILINAYACSPGMGSEPGMAWNWCINLAKYCELHIITEGEFRDKIEAVLPELPQGKNMHFYYNPVSDKVRKMCWNQGDWRFYRYYRKWQWKTYLIAKEICVHERIDIIHQLNMIGFREPGYLWKIENIPFVWGPIGGLKLFPLAYLRGAGWKLKVFNRVKNIISILQLKHSSRVDKALRHSKILISSIPDSYMMIKKYKGLESVIIPETGCYVREEVERSVETCTNSKMRVLWVGKFDFRKQLGLAIRTIAEIRDLNIELVVCGTGNDAQVKYYMQLAEDLDVSRLIDWKGRIDNTDVLREMRNADLFFFTSVSDDTSTVVMEAISNGLPVLCFDACGFGYVVNNMVGMKATLSTPDDSVFDFKEKIKYLYEHRDILYRLSQGCKQRQEELSWDNKAKQVVELYKECITENNWQRRQY